MPYFDEWFPDYWEAEWWDPDTGTPAAPSGNGGISKSKILGTIAPKPALPPWRQIAGPTGEAFTDIRRFLADTLDRPENWGNHVTVTFTAANTPTRVDTGLGAAPKGYKQVRSDAAISVFDATPTTPLDPTRDRGVHYLQASAPGTVTLIFY